MAKNLSPATALAIHDLRHEVTRIRLGAVAGHDELWGALGAAGNALDYAAQIANRDVDPRLRPANVATRKGKKR